MRKILAALVALSLLSSPVYAATKSPTPTKKLTAKASVKPTAKVTAKATAKAAAKTTTKSTAKATAKTTAKATSKVTSKATAKTTAKATAKATSKATATKKAVAKKTTSKPKPKPTRTKKITSRSPEPWPPKGYAQNGDIFAKIPTSFQLYEEVGHDKTGKLAKATADCPDFVCGAVFVGSELGCLWWEIKSDVLGPVSETDSTKIKYGELTSYFPKTKAKFVEKFVLRSDEPYNSRFLISNIRVACNRSDIPPDITVPSYTYVKVTT